MQHFPPYIDFELTVERSLPVALVVKIYVYGKPALAQPHSHDYEGGWGH